MESEEYKSSIKSPIKPSKPVGKARKIQVESEDDILQSEESNQSIDAAPIKQLRRSPRKSTSPLKQKWEETSDQDSPLRKKTPVQPQIPLFKTAAVPSGYNASKHSPVAIRKMP